MTIHLAGREWSEADLTRFGLYLREVALLDTGSGTIAAIGHALCHQVNDRFHLKSNYAGDFKLNSGLFNGILLDFWMDFKQFLIEWDDQQSNTMLGWLLDNLNCVDDKILVIQDLYEKSDFSRADQVSDLLQGMSYTETIPDHFDRSIIEDFIETSLHFLIGAKRIDLLLDHQWLTQSPIWRCDDYHQVYYYRDIYNQAIEALTRRQS